MNKMCDKNIITKSINEAKNEKNIIEFFNSLNYSKDINYVFDKYKEKSECKDCKRIKKYYCYHCDNIWIDKSLIPNIKLPIDLVMYFNEI